MKTNGLIAHLKTNLIQGIWDHLTVMTIPHAIP